MSRAGTPVVCGRYTHLFTWKQLHRLMRLTTTAEELRPRYNVAPTQNAPIVRQDADGVRRGAMLRWGLIPSWAQDPAIGNRMINARAETAAEKPAFRAAMARRRCLVPVSGFYEWKKLADGKQPHYIRRADAEPFAFAGLWESWSRGPDTIESFTILTTGPNNLMRPLHDRMPVIVPPGDYDRWLDAAVTDARSLAPLLVPFGGGDFVEFEVSRRVNSPAQDVAACIEPVVPQ